MRVKVINDTRKLHEYLIDLIAYNPEVAISCEFTTYDYREGGRVRLISFAEEGLVDERNTPIIKVVDLDRISQYNYDCGGVPALPTGIDVALRRLLEDRRATKRFRGRAEELSWFDYMYVQHWHSRPLDLSEVKHKLVYDGDLDLWVARRGPRENLWTPMVLTMETIGLAATVAYRMMWTPENTYRVL